MTKTQTQILETLTGLLSDEEKPVYLPIVETLTGLGYLPEKRSVRAFSLAFKHPASKKIMARLDFPRDGENAHAALLAIKFFGAKTVPAKCTAALARDIEARHGQYSGPLRSATEKNRCGFCQDRCTGGGLGYYVQYPDGREALRCGAYPIPIPGLTADDVEDVKRVIREQHEYFLTIA